MSTPSPKQQAARARSWKIFRLRGLRDNLNALSSDRRKLVAEIVNDELLSIGASLESKTPSRGLKKRKTASI